MVLLEKSNGSKSMIPIDHAVLARVGIFDRQPFVGEESYNRYRWLIGEHINSGLSKVAPSRSVREVGYW